MCFIHYFCNILNEPFKLVFSSFQKYKLLKHLLTWSARIQCRGDISKSFSWKYNILLIYPRYPCGIWTHDLTLVSWVREYLRGKYHCTIDLLFDWFGISCISTDNFCFYLQNRLIQTGQTGGQLYSDTSPFSVPCLQAPFVRITK